MRTLLKVVAWTLWSVALMCVGISFIVLCVFHSDLHTVGRVAEIGLGSAAVLAVLGKLAYPGSLVIGQR